MPGLNLPFDLDALSVSPFSVKVSGCRGLSCMALLQAVLTRKGRR